MTGPLYLPFTATAANDRCQPDAFMCFKPLTTKQALSMAKPSGSAGTFRRIRRGWSALPKYPVGSFSERSASRYRRSETHLSEFEKEWGPTAMSKREQLQQELEEVEAASHVLQEYIRAPNIPLPENFPELQLIEICSSLSNLRHGSAEGCRIPLEYARLRLPAIRRDFIARDSQEGANRQPIHSRGFGLDRPLAELTIAVSTALDAYSRISSEKLDDTVIQELQVDPSSVPLTASTIEQSLFLSSEVEKTARQISSSFDGFDEKGDELGRSLRDAENLNILARAELRGRVVVRWFRKVVGAFRLSPKKLRYVSKTLLLTKDAAQIWDNFNAKVFQATIEALEETAQKFENEARALESKVGTQKFGFSEVFDIYEAIRVIESGNQVSAEHARHINTLELKNFRPRNTDALSKLVFLQSLKFVGSSIFDVGGLSPLTKLRTLYLRRFTGSNLSPLASLVDLRSLSITQIGGESVSLDFLSQLTQITDLQLSLRKGADLSPIGDLQELRSLRITGESIIDFSLLKGCSKLRDVTFWSAQLKNMPEIVNLSQLQSIDLRRTHGVDLFCLRDLSSLKKLKIKDIDPLELHQIKELKDSGVSVSLK